MKAGKIGVDYVVHVSFLECYFLTSKTLETSLIDATTGRDLQKKVSLVFSQTNALDGIALSYEPTGSFEKAEKVQIELNMEALSKFSRMKQLSTRYDGTNMLDLFMK